MITRQKTKEQVRVIVPTSGGKDSQACLKLALESCEPHQVMGLFCDTQFEHPLTYKHIEWMSKHYGVHIHTLRTSSVEEQVLRFGRFPGGGARHCTDYLKIRPTKWFLKEWGQPVQVWYGMRFGESAERSARYKEKIDTELYAPHEVMPSKYPKYLEKMGVMFRLPILEWTGQDVMGYVGAGRLNPLYAQGFDRVGCFPCLAAGDATKEKAFKHDDFGKEQYRKVVMMEQEIGKSVYTSKGAIFRRKQIVMFDEKGECAICAYG